MRCCDIRQILVPFLRNVTKNLFAKFNAKRRIACFKAFFIRRISSRTADPASSDIHCLNFLVFLIRVTPKIVIFFHAMVNLGLLVGLSSTLIIDAFVASPRATKHMSQRTLPLFSTGLFRAAETNCEKTRNFRKVMKSGLSPIFCRLRDPAQNLFKQRHELQLPFPRSLRSRKRSDTSRMQGSNFDYSPLTSEEEDPKGAWKQLADWAWMQGIRWGEWKVAETLPGIRGAVATKAFEEGEVRPSTRAARALRQPTPAKSIGSLRREQTAHSRSDCNGR
jgi:hypothetical protein